MGGSSSKDTKYNDTCNDDEQEDEFLVNKDIIAIKHWFKQQCKQYEERENIKKLLSDFKKKESGGDPRLFDVNNNLDIYTNRDKYEVKCFDQKFTISMDQILEQNKEQKMLHQIKPINGQQFHSAYITIEPNGYDMITNKYTSFVMKLTIYA